MNVYWKNWPGSCGQKPQGGLLHLALPFPAGELGKFLFHSANETQLNCLFLQIYLTLAT